MGVARSSPTRQISLGDSPIRWLFLIAQLVKNLPAMQETWVQSLGWEDPLEKGKATHSSILSWRIPAHGVPKSQTRLSDFHFSGPGSRKSRVRKGVSTKPVGKNIGLSPGVQISCSTLTGLWS